MIFGVDAASAGVKKEVSWSRTKAETPASFALLRAAWGVKPDAIFPREWDRARAAGLVRGAYLFLRFRTRKNGAAPSPAAQAKAMVAALAGRIDRGRDLPPALDVEFPGEGAKETQLTPAQLLDGVRVSWKILADEYGVAPLIYTSRRVWKEDLADQPAPDLVESPLWLARYPFKEGPAVRDPVRVTKVAPAVPPPWGDAQSWFIHQYQGDAVAVPGFAPTEKVDMNRFHAVTRGDRGDNVRWIQRRLGMATASGIIDDATDAALRAFQGKKGLTVDGVIGPKTFAALCWA